mmetsp:Transcript_46305/g.93474  ORF Transcript_46305/g.93474 Transcript_46305/m.93474 type:complete len:219 (+) Transcript_46305:14-670(+)
MARPWIYLIFAVVFRNVVSDTVLSAHKDEVQPFDPQGGSAYYTSHSTPVSLDGAAHQFESWADNPLLEFHFHPYFFQGNDASVADAMRLKSELINGVVRGDFTLVCDGVNRTILDGFTSEDDVPSVNMAPMGPHPIGSFEVWVPAESLAAVMSHMMMHRGELSILFHPLSPHCVEDHTGRATWLGPSFNIDRTVLAFDDPECDALQYPELGFGYSAPR